MPRLPVRIVGHNLPGLRFCAYEPVYVGLKRGKEVEAPRPGDSAEVVFDLYVDVRPDRAGNLDYRGPYISGLGKHDRTVGLIWGVVDAEGHFELFRGAKLRLPPIDERLEQALSSGATLQATVDLTDDRGEPVAAQVPDTKLMWKYVR